MFPSLATRVHEHAPEQRRNRNVQRNLICSGENLVKNQDGWEHWRRECRVESCDQKDMEAN